MQVHKQAFHNSVTKSYQEIIADVGGARLFTLGLIPSFARYLILFTEFLQSVKVQTYSPIVPLGYALGGALLSHPFEVARVIIQYNGASSGLFGDPLKIMRVLYASEGIAGLYRGVVPSTITLLPKIVILASMRRRAHTTQ